MKTKLLIGGFGILLLFTFLSMISCARTAQIPTPQSTQNTILPVASPTNTPQPTPGLTPRSIPNITDQDAYNLMQKNKDNPNLMVIDVRTSDEFNSGHIANAINIDYYSPDFKNTIGKLDKNKQYVVYCKTGVRGASATEIMQDLGFKNVRDLAGGLDKWIQDGYPTTS